MAGLKEICQVAYDQIYPNAEANTAIQLEHFLVVAKTRYAHEMFIISKELKRSEGEWEIPDSLLREATLDIVDNEADISGIKIFKSLDGLWIARLGDYGCECGYTKHSANVSHLLCDEDYHGNSKPYTPIGNKIKFPYGTHGKTVPITYGSNGEDLDDEIYVDDIVGDRVGDYLFKRFSGKLPEDRTLNSNANV